VAIIGQTDAGVVGDEAQLVTAVANLLENAVNYSPRGTRVGLGVRCVGDTVEISIADEGIGIAEKDLERVFERFYRADPARSRETGGTGLGLAIVKHIVTNHGGSVGVWSAEGAGSTFTLRLPAFLDDQADNPDFDLDDVADVWEPNKPPDRREPKEQATGDHMTRNNQLTDGSSKDGRPADQQALEQ
jgi:two-component system sensor histidine kinase SenX3